jgi:hypothetical protein
MSDILTQEEIDALLNVNGENSTPALARYSIEAFEEFLTNREFNPEKPYGLFEEDISVCRFFDFGGNEGLLEDIKRKNEEEGHGNVRVPNTDITLINYSFCPTCKTVFSFRDITDYYKNPKPDPRYENRARQYREDTRVCCGGCGAYFLPSLVISDGTPRNEVQFLCRVQTIDAVETYFSEENIAVLTKNKRNIIRRDDCTAIKNDVLIKDLDKKPTLITNMVQYTPFNLIMNLIDGTNVEKGDLLFDEWK